jgi:uncharacterized protein YdiU (UPF0061 family)
LIDGRHPWQEKVPEGYVAYPVRKLDRGQVSYFNFALAREMGLIPSNHGDVMTPELEKKILETFCLQIINEYDQQNGLLPPKSELKTHPYMATRYLQLQHTNKQGKTSGDGRSVWNGTLRTKGVTWDISSRGTGVTCLAPGAVQANKPLKTGDDEFGYGCGLADVTELFGSSIMSEIFHLHGITTERMLTIIDLGRGTGIGVRAAPNLLRPAHLFLYLKQGRRDELKRATDYLIDRQSANGVWNFGAEHPERYQLMLRQIALSFARFAADLERHYVFAWLDWDGDNVLADAGIIDYGSIRQFGLRHDQYRYDDVQRYSTNLNEQRGKARLTVQVFAQLAEYLETGKRKSLESFARHSVVREFDREFDHRLRYTFLAQVGFEQKQIDELMAKNKIAVERLYNAFTALEKTKTKAGMRKLPDGINRPAVFNMRRFLREYPTLVFGKKDSLSAIPCEEVLDLIASSFAKRADLRLKGALREKVSSLQRAYIDLIKTAAGSSLNAAFVKSLIARSQDANRSGRITGNGSEYIVEAITKARRRGLTPAQIQTAIDLFIASQAPREKSRERKTLPASLESPVGRLYQELLSIALEFEEDI